MPRSANLIAELGLDRPVLVGYDVGGRDAQAIARDVGHFTPLEAPDVMADGVRAVLARTRHR